MLKYTSDSEGIKKLRREIPDGVIEITLLNDESYIGVVIGERAGNNAFEALKTGNWKYYGGITLLSIKNEKIDIDKLDIKKIIERPDKKDDMLSTMEKMGYKWAV